MKKLSILALAAATILISCQGSNSDKSATSEQQEVAKEKGTSYAVDEQQSTLKWTGYHKGGLNPRFGMLKTSGTVAVEDGVVNAGSFTFDINSLTTNEKSVDAATSGGKTSVDLDAHLKSADFFDKDKYPTAKFEITNVKAFDPTQDKSNIPDANFIVSGNLTLKDKTVNVTFPAKITVNEADLNVSSKFAINRQDWGLTYGTEGNAKDWMISQEIDIELNITAKK